jgi:hypothetical protein
VDRAWVVAMLIENVQRAMQVEPVRGREGASSQQLLLVADYLWSILLRSEQRA